MSNATDRANLGPTDAELREMYQRMVLIRRMEERLSKDFFEGKLPGAVHLYIGQEAVATGVCAHLDDSDWITSTHRGHGHFLAKGGDPRTMMAEIWGRKNGICKGMGGSMHVADVSKGILGANGIVGAGLSITVGAGFGARLDGDGKVSVCFFGDGASNQGVLMESLNISTLWELPVIFVCENNTFSEFSPAKTVTAGNIIDRARAFGMPCESVDGNDLLAVWTAFAVAADRARKGEGPSFIEAHTYRIHGHIEAEKDFLAGENYRTEDEVTEWRKRCPIDRLGAYMVEAGISSPSDLDAVDAKVMGEVEAAAEFAAAGEPADPELVFDITFSGQRP